MAVLVEALSVIIRLAAIERVYEDGWSSFVELVPSQMLCADDDLARVGFMLPDAVGDFLEKLEARGLVYLEDDECVDVAVVDQQTGVMMPCDWLEFARVKFQGGLGKVSLCWLFKGPRIAPGIDMPEGGLTMAAPAGWDH